MTQPDIEAQLDREALRTLELIGPDPENWVPEQAGIDHNVFIIGGGQTGSAFAFALRRAGIGKVTVVDAAGDSRSAGVWLTRARMTTLRTPKTLVGPEGGLPGLGFQAWYEARHGAAAYRAFERAPREAWAAYLAWYRGFLGITVRYATRVTRIEPVTTDAGSHFRLHLQTDDGARVETARKVLLCNGVAGNGAAYLPPVAAKLPAAMVAHTSHEIDFAALRGKSVAVLGGAASAFDAAGTALEAGAAQVHLFIRRSAIANVSVSRARGYPGAYDNYFALPDAVRWAQALRFKRAGSTPPPSALARVAGFSNFHLHLASEWESASELNGRVAVTTRKGESFEFDFVVAGTGYVVDPAVRPELDDFSPHILRWSDRYAPAAADEDAQLGAYPYLGNALQYLERVPGAAPYLGNIHVYNPAGLVSGGVPVGDVPSMRRDIPSVVRGISQDLFLADIDAHSSRLSAPVPADFDEAAYAARVWPGSRMEP